MRYFCQFLSHRSWAEQMGNWVPLHGACESAVRIRPQTRLSSADRMLKTHSPKRTPRRIGGIGSSMQGAIHASFPFYFRIEFRLVLSNNTPDSAWRVST